MQRKDFLPDIEDLPNIENQKQGTNIRPGSYPLEILMPKVKEWPFAHRVFLATQIIVKLISIRSCMCNEDFSILNREKTEEQIKINVKAKNEIDSIEIDIDMNDTFSASKNSEIKGINGEKDDVYTLSILLEKILKGSVPVQFKKYSLIELLTKFSKTMQSNAPDLRPTLDQVKSVALNLNSIAKLGVEPSLVVRLALEAGIANKVFIARIDENIAHKEHDMTTLADTITRMYIYDLLQDNILKLFFSDKEIPKLFGLVFAKQGYYSLIVSFLSGLTCDIKNVNPDEDISELFKLIKDCESSEITCDYRHCVANFLSEVTDNHHLAIKQVVFNILKALIDSTQFEEECDALYQLMNEKVRPNLEDSLIAKCKSLFYRDTRWEELSNYVEKKKNSLKMDYASVLLQNNQQRNTLA